MSRSETTRGPGSCSSRTTAAPTPFSAIRRAASRRVWPVPTVRTTLDIPSRTSMCSWFLQSRSRLVQIRSNPIRRVRRTAGGTARTGRIASVLSRLDPQPGACPSRLAAVALLGLLAVAGCDASENADTDRGRALFQAKCGTCHALAQAGTTANDRARPRLGVRPRAPTAWTTTRSRASSRRRSRTRARSRRAYELRPGLHAGRPRRRPGRRGRRHLRRERRRRPRGRAAGAPARSALRRALRELPRAGRRRHRRQHRPEPRRGPGRRGREARLHSRRRSSTRTPRSPRASPRA